MRTRTYKVGLKSLEVSESNGIITTTLNGAEPISFDDVREAAVSIGDTVGDWITKSILAEAASEGLDIWKGLKNEHTNTDGLDENQARERST